MDCTQAVKVGSVYSDWSVRMLFPSTLVDAIQFTVGERERRAASSTESTKCKVLVNKTQMEKSRMVRHPKRRNIYIYRYKT